MHIVFATHITPRLQYILQTLLGNDVSIVDDKEVYLNSESPKINYAAERIAADEFWVRPYGLLDEKNIQPQSIECFEWDGLTAFFKTAGDFPFDVFSAAFYLLTRYEEYLPHTKDMYDRYAHENSLAFKENFLHLPLVNLWMKALQSRLSFTTHHSPFAFIPTYDIDFAYCYQHHSVLKNIAGFFNDFLKGAIDKVTDRASVYSGSKPDPFDVYAWLDALHEQHQLQPIYFFLVANKRLGYDKNISPKKPAMKRLMQHHASKYQVGLHPSWQSGDNPFLLEQEKQTIEAHIHKQVLTSRQHYIRMDLPNTYRRLIAAGIQQDYSMGYGSINGFRASYTLPFKWYDLEKETISHLTIHPFCYMEANSYFEQKNTIEEATKELQQYHDVVKAVNGQLITIFHNHFITKQPQWRPWRNMYEAFLNKNC
jgi:hypothetical protein